MRSICWLTANLLLQGTLAALLAQQPSVSTASLSREQVAVYEAFFSQNRKDQSVWLNVAQQTFILQPDDGDYQGCMIGFDRAQRPASVRRFSNEFASASRVHLIDPKDYKTNDPLKAMFSGESAESAVQNAFRSGLFTVSEIIFDKKHHRAAFRYGFVCGDLCGHSETVVYEKRKGKWTPIERSCGYGIS